MNIYGEKHPLLGTTKLRYFQGPAKLVNTISEEFQTQFSNKLTEVHITDGELDENGFNYINRSKKSLHTIDLAGTTNIAINDLAFYDCYKLENLALPSNLETIGFKAVAECLNLKSIEIPATVKEIEDGAFYNCHSMNSVKFAENGTLTKIGSWAFHDNYALKSISIPEGVKTIGDAAFYGCTYLEDITLPSTVQSVGDNAFALCNKVKRMEVKAVTPPSIESKTFYEVSREIEFIIPEEAREVYAEHEYWKEFIQKAPNSVEDNESVELVVYSQNGMLYIEGITSNYRLFDATGKLIYTGCDAQLSLPNGIYLLNVDNKTYKVAM